MKDLNWEDYEKALKDELTSPLPKKLSPPIPEEIKIDSRLLNGKGWFLPIKGERFDGHSSLQDTLEKEQALGCFCEESYRSNFSQNLQEKMIFVKSSFEALKKIASYKRNSQKNLTVFGITGSVGKTSTKNILASILEQTGKAVLTSQKNYNTEIGLSLTLLNLKEKHSYAVLEMGARKQGDIRILKEIAKPNICLCLMVGSSHIGVFGSKENIYKAKLEIIEAQMKGQKNIVLADDLLLLEKAKKIDPNCYTYGYSEKANARIVSEEISPEGTMKTLFKLPEDSFSVQFKTFHKALARNALAASLMAHLAGVESKKIQEGLEKFSPPESRFKALKTKDYLLVDDSYNASPESIKAGVQTLKALYPNKKITYFLGDILELGDFSHETHLDLALFFQKELKPFKVITIGKEFKKSFLELSHKKPLPFDLFSFSSSDEFISSQKKTHPLGEILYFKGAFAMNLKKIIDFFLHK